MLKNYFKIAFRNLWRRKVFSFLNILGLTVGMTAFFLIFLYVRFELTYDASHSKVDRIYRMVADLKTPTETINTNCPAWAVGPNIQLEFPEVEAAVRLSNASMLIKQGEKSFMEDKLLAADSAFFKVFDFKLIRGDRRTALNDLFSIVLSERAAKKYFGDDDPMGKTMLIGNDNYNAKVTGIIKNLPENSTIKGDVLLSMNSVTRKMDARLDSQWTNYGNRTYLLLKGGTDPVAFQKKLPSFLERRNGSEMKALQMFPTLLLEPLRKVYLYSTRDDSKTGHISNVYIFSIIGIFILLIACINFVNLTTARSSERAKEVGIRKVVGAGKTQLARQFIGESILICLIAFILTVALSALMLPLFNQLSGKIVSDGIFSEPQLIILMLGVAICIGLLAGFYPALVLTSFQPISVLKGRFATGTRGILLRKGLVVTQFSISIALIIATIIVYTQMNFMRVQDLGFKKENKLVVDTQYDPAKNAFREAIKSIPGVVSTTFASSVPSSSNPGAYTKIENAKGEMQAGNMNQYFVDFDYLKQYGLKVLAGRDFSREFGTDTTKAIIINESAVKQFGYTTAEQAVGKKFDQWGRTGTIIGVVKDFHFRTLQEQIMPLGIRIEPGAYNILTAQLAGNNPKATLASIEDKWKELVPGKPFTYFFLDDHFDAQYVTQDRFGKLFFNFSILAIFISCLGLLGLASYSTMQRTKEIGVRKVMGASVHGIVGLLSKDFLKLIGIAFVIATPVAWYLMNSWLKDFPYRTNIGVWVFALAGILAMLVAIVTISFQAVRAALMNPVKSLRTE